MMSVHEATSRVLATPDEAKLALLHWADGHDARRRTTRSHVGAIVTAGAVTLLAAIAISWLLPRRSSNAKADRRGGLARFLIRLALIARVGRWLLPYATTAVRQLKARSAMRMSLAPAGMTRD